MIVDFVFSESDPWAGLQRGNSLQRGDFPQRGNFPQRGHFLQDIVFLLIWSQNKDWEALGPPREAEI